MPNINQLNLFSCYGCTACASICGKTAVIRIVLESLNHEVEILNYDEFSQHPLWYIKPFLSSVKDHLVCFFNKTDSHINLKRKQIEAFSSFDKNIIKPTKKKLRFSFQLRKAVIDKDCVLSNQNSRIYNLLSNLELSQCHITNMKR